MNESVKVAIIGGGPAGIGAALTLAQEGIGPVCVLEREQEIGGAARHCGHPSFGVLPFKRLMTGPGLARTLRRKTEGMDIRLGWSVTEMLPGGVLSVVTPEGPKTLTAERVIVATGARETPRAARLVSGMRPIGVTTTGALQQFVYLRGLKPFRRPVIVGSETVSFSALWTLLRGGMRAVAMIEPEAHCQFYWPSGLLPGLVGAPLYTGTEITSINGTQRVESVSVRRADGREQTIACDGVVFSGNFVSENFLTKDGFLAEAPGRMGPRADQYLRCSDPAYFAAGNMLHPVDLGDRCFLEGERSARQVVASLRPGTLPERDRVDLLIKAPLRMISPSVLVPGSGQAPVTFLVKTEPFARGSLVFRQNGKEILRRSIQGHADRFTRIKGFDPGRVTVGSPLEVSLEPA